MKRILLSTTMIMLLFGSGCGKDPQDEVLIRIRNTSAYDYAGLTVNTGSNQHHYGDVQSKTVSDYISFDYVYRYASVSLLINGDTLRFIPFDYVGEQKRTKGKYTYEIDANITQKTLSIHFVED